MQIHDGPYNVIKNWDYCGLVEALRNGEGEAFMARVGGRAGGRAGAVPLQYRCSTVDAPVPGRTGRGPLPEAEVGQYMH